MMDATHLDVFWVGEDGQIWTQWWDQSAGQNWTDHGPFPIASSFPVPAQEESPIAALSRIPGHLDVFWVGEDGQIWTQWWDQSAGQNWTDHAPFPIAPGFPVPALGGSVAAVSRTPGHLDVFWAGALADVGNHQILGGQIWTQWWDQSAGQNWTDHAPFPIASSFPVPARADSPIAAVGRATATLQ